MKIEEFKKRLNECLMDTDSLLDEEIDNLYVFFKEFAKSYARSLVPEEKEIVEEEVDDAARATGMVSYEMIENIGWNKCREEMLRRIEEEY